jgi:hypothetical protein
VAAASLVAAGMSWRQRSGDLWQREAAQEAMVRSLLPVVRGEWREEQVWLTGRHHRQGRTHCGGSFAEKEKKMETTKGLEARLL